jgi:ribosomal-protein-alanine N-acetyltransferase
VRLITEEDIPAVSRLDREAFPDMKMPTNFQNELKNCLARYIVVCKDRLSVSDNNEDYIVGYAGVWIMVGEVHIVNIAVSNDYRRQGIGELLLIALIELALRMCCNMITLEARISNVTPKTLQNSLTSGSTEILYG